MYKAFHRLSYFIDLIIEKKYKWTWGASTIFLGYKSKVESILLPQLQKLIGFLLVYRWACHAGMSTGSKTKSQVCVRSCFTAFYSKALNLDPK